MAVILECPENDELLNEFDFEWMESAIALEHGEPRPRTNTSACCWSKTVPFFIVKRM